MPPTRTLRPAVLLPAACMLALLAGCGQKGPLYLPPPPPADAGYGPPPGAAALPPDAGEPPDDGALSLRGALEVDVTAFPSGEGVASNDVFFGLRPILALDAGPDFYGELSSYFRLRLFDDPPESRSRDIGGVLRGADWDEPSDFGQILRLIRIGPDGGAVQARLGATRKKTLGHGYLVNRYSNQENPDYHPASASLSLAVGPLLTEAFVSDVFGARIFAGELGFDLGWFFSSDPKVHGRYHVRASLAHDAGLAGYHAPTVTLFHTDADAVLYRSESTRIFLVGGFGMRGAKVSSDVGAVLGFGADADFGDLQVGGKVEVRKQYGGFRHGFFGPTYELSRFSALGFSGPPQALDALPDNWSLYGELRLGTRETLSTDVALEHFFYGRTDLDCSVSVNVFRGIVAGGARFTVVGLGQTPRYATSGELRVRFLSFMYGLVHGGLVYLPQPDLTLVRGYTFGLGVAADFTLGKKR